MKSPKLSVSYLSFLVLFLLSACKPPVLLNTLSVEKDESVEARVRFEVKSKKESSFTEAIESFQTDKIFQFEDLPVAQVNISFILDGNSRIGYPNSQKAMLDVELELEGDKEDTAKTSVKIKDLSVFVNGEKQKDIDCSSLLRLSGQDGGHIQFSMRGLVDGLGACEGKGVLGNSPRFIGMRDVGRGSNFYSPEEDVQLGRDFTEDYLRENRDTVLPSSHPTTRYLQGVMNEIAANSDNPHGFRPRVFVINADVLNAFALPGGDVYVFTGLIDKSENEDQLIGVLGHEWAHVTARHGTRNVSRAVKIAVGTIVAQIALGIISERNDGEWSGVLASVMAPMVGVGGQLFMLNKGRKAELEADRFGSQYAMKAGYEPWGLAGMFEIFKLNMGRSSSLEEIFSTHPDHDRRIGQVVQLSSLYYPRYQEGYSSERSFELARQSLQSLPQPSAQQSEAIATAFASQVTDFTQSLVVGKTEDRVGAGDDGSDSTED